MVMNLPRAQSALVLGGASGIGAAIARKFADEGWAVVIADANADAGRALAQELADSKFVLTDVAIESDVIAAIELAESCSGGLSAVVHSAGLVGATGTILELRAEDWRNTQAVLFDSVFYTVKHAGRSMAHKESGAILVIASIAGVSGGVGPHAYTAGKHGAVGIVKTAASELAEHGVRVNAIAPGTVVTPMITNLHGGQAEAIRSSAASTALARAILPEEIADLAHFLCASAPSITGQVIVVDGGRSVAPAKVDGQSIHNRPSAFRPSIVKNASPDPTR